MKVSLGVNSVAIDRRYSFEWLFDLMAEAGVYRLQLASFFEMYFLEDEWFFMLKEKAEQRGIRITSVFTSVRELGGLMLDDPHLQRVARENYLKVLNAAVAVGADYAGSTMGAAMRDDMSVKQRGMARVGEYMKELMFVGKEKGLKGLILEPLSCLAEPPTLPEECDSVMSELSKHHRDNPDTIPYYFCSDITHGYADADGKVVHDSYSLFTSQIPHMCEFHFKNTDSIFNSTFGFDGDNLTRGIVDLQRLKNIIDTNAAEFPVQDVNGYLEVTGPKCGRDYSDHLLGGILKDSLKAIKDVFTDS